MYKLDEPILTCRFCFYRVKFEADREDRYRYYTLLGHKTCGLRDSEDIGRYLALWLRDTKWGRPQKGQ